MADQIISNTQTAAVKAAAIAERVQRELLLKAKLAATVYDVSSFAKPGIKSITFPKLSAFTVANRASGVKGESQVITATGDTLDLNNPAYVSWIIDANDELQSSIPWQATLAVKAAAGHGRFVDTKILEALDLVAQETATAGGITDDLLVELRKNMVDNHVEPEDCTLLLSTTEYSKVLKLDKFVSADKLGTSNIQSGVVGRIYGLNVMEYAGLATGFYCYHKEAIALGFQAAPKIGSQPAIEYGTGAERKAMDQLFGVKGLQIAENGAPAGKSPLVFKYNAP